MKKSYSLLKIATLLFGFSTLSYGQLLQQTSKPANMQTVGFVTTTIGGSSSPNFGHAHDSEGHCLTDAMTNHWIQNAGIEEQYHLEEEQQAVMAQNFEGGNRSTYVVPIIFHVVHNPASPAENVSQSAIYALLDAVNEDFNLMNADAAAARTALGFVPANADIEFCLAQRDPSGNQLTELGIHRVSTTEGYYDVDTETNKMKGNTGGDTGTPVWNRNNYVNVWICDITNGATSGVAGYAYKPTVSTLPPASIDGIVIDYNLGMDPGNRVLTHELGHYLGLSHTWGGTDGAGCSNGNDLLTDTPNTAGPSFDYPLTCSGLQQTCPGVNTQYENYMDYSNCTVMFTTEQCNLMELVITGSRNSLNSSNGCDPVNPVPPVADFVADITTVIQGGSVNFTDLSTNFPTSWSWSVSPSAGVTYINSTSSTSQDPTMQFTNTGLYTITLVATNGVGNDTEVKTNYINVISSGGGTTACDTLRNYTQSEEANMTAYTVTGGTGYFPGHLFLPGTNDFQLMRVCDSFYVSAPTQVRRIYLPVFQADDMGGANNVTFTVWASNGATPGPGAVLGTQVVPITSLDAGLWNEISFTTPVPVSGEFWVGAQLAYPATGIQDTVIFATTLFTDRPSGPGTTWVQGYEPDLMLNFNWQSVTSLFTSDPNSSLILDVLTSNGPNPTAVVSFP
ncbi:MAG: PKD domain-containing protein, partial [Crocinitomicaceae bacterium]|nr:PKD domain-containing protein [Crocinitomicaceae bacterium]